MKLRVIIDIPDDIEDPRCIAVAIAVASDAFGEMTGADLDFDVEDEDKEHDLWKMVLGFIEDLSNEVD